MRLLVLSFVILGALLSPLRAEEGPNITDPGKSARIVKGTQTKIDRTQPIDLARTPWLVESVGVPADSSVFQRERLIWADSLLWTPIAETVGPEILVERWVNEPPKDLAGKYVLIEVWATWCPPCRRSLPLLNFYQEKYQDKLVVVSICETDEQALREMEKIKGVLPVKDMKFHLAVDTGRRFANKLGVFGIPHAVLLEPTRGGVVWEGMPTWIGYELDDKTLEKYLAIGAKLKAAGKLPKESPVRFATQPVDPTEKLRRPQVGTRHGDGEPCVQPASNETSD